MRLGLDKVVTLAYSAGIATLLFFALQANANVFNLHKEYGIRADTFQIEPKSIPEPTLSHSKKSFVTEKKFGFDVLTTESNWVIETFLNDIKPNMLVMDVGSGYGSLSREALKRGATVISNEISENQLIYNLKHLKSEEKSRFYFNQRDIRSVSLDPNTLDLIVFHRVLHFFNGNEIEEILSKSLEWLKPNGKIYIVMMSKDHIAFRDKINYDIRKKWPGENLLDTEKHLPEQAYALPKNLHVISIDTLKNNLENLGYSIIRSDYVSLQKVGTEKNRDGKEAIGIIAEKKSKG